MQRIKDMLAESETIGDSDRELLLKLLWLHLQVPDDIRLRASKRLEAFMDRDTQDWPAFIAEVRAVVLDLELVVARSRSV